MPLKVKREKTANPAAKAIKAKAKAVKTPRQNPTPASDIDTRKIIAFDFDGTLTDRDSFVTFLTFASGRLKLAASLLGDPGMLADYLKTKDRGKLKSVILYKLLGKISQQELETLIRSFVTAMGMSLFRPDALEAWGAHDLPDRQRVIVTASPQLLVAPFGALIGADRVIGTRLGFSDDGRLTPNLEGANCRGEEKMIRLREAFGSGLDLEAAYGDTEGDREMLAAARHGHYRVFTAKP